MHRFVLGIKIYFCTCDVSNIIGAINYLDVFRFLLFFLQLWWKGFFHLRKIFYSFSTSHPLLHLRDLYSSIIPSHTWIFKLYPCIPTFPSICKSLLIWSNKYHKISVSNLSLFLDISQYFFFFPWWLPSSFLYIALFSLRNGLTS